MAGRGRKRSCDIGTPQEIWEYMYGTENYGNLPEHLKYTHAGHCWAPCPYSTQATAIRTRHLLGLADTDPLPIGSLTRTDHTDVNGMVYYLKTHGKGPVWGYECTFDDCPYYLVYSKRYFYV